MAMGHGKGGLVILPSDYLCEWQVEIVRSDTVARCTGRFHDICRVKAAEGQ